MLAMTQSNTGSVVEADNKDSCKIECLLQNDIKMTEWTLLQNIGLQRETGDDNKFCYVQNLRKVLSVSQRKGLERSRFEAKLVLSTCG